MSPSLVRDKVQGTPTKHDHSAEASHHAYEVVEGRYGRLRVGAHLLIKILSYQ